ncbi:MAG: hypothetical protein ABSC72_13250 [Methylovirgula sp.]|jgi:hypothetical protein
MADMPESDLRLSGAPEDGEIEITPEMIAAGLEAFKYCDERYGSLEDGVEAIYIAMLQARKRSSKEL